MCPTTGGHEATPQACNLSIYRALWCILRLQLLQNNSLGNPTPKFVPTGSDQMSSGEIPPYWVLPLESWFKDSSQSLCKVKPLVCMSAMLQHYSENRQKARYDFSVCPVTKIHFLLILTLHLQHKTATTFHYAAD